MDSHLHNLELPTSNCDAPHILSRPSCPHILLRPYTNLQSIATAFDAITCIDCHNERFPLDSALDCGYQYCRSIYLPTLRELVGLFRMCNEKSGRPVLTPEAVRAVRRPKARVYLEAGMAMQEPNTTDIEFTPRSERRRQHF